MNHTAIWRTSFEQPLVLALGRALGRAASLVDETSRIALSRRLLPPQTERTHPRRDMKRWLRRASTSLALHRAFRRLALLSCRQTPGFRQVMCLHLQQVVSQRDRQNMRCHLRHRCSTLRFPRHVRQTGGAMADAVYLYTYI